MLLPQTDSPKPEHKAAINSPRLPAIELALASFLQLSGEVGSYSTSL
jgi:hypothetical protein